MASFVHAAEFRTGQAARAVIGQSSFTSHEPGIRAQSLAYSNGILYVADDSGRILTFDHVPGPKEEVPDQPTAACTLCGFSPSSVTQQAVSTSASTYSVYGKAVAMVDPVNHRVLIWRDSHSLNAANGPDVILESSGENVPIDNSTLIEPVSVALDGKRLFVGDRGLRRILVWNTLPVSSTQGADVVLGQANFTAVDALNAGPDHFADPHGLVSDGINLFVADSVNRRILVFSPGDLPLLQDATVNSASLKAGPLAPGTLVTINGQHFSESVETSPDDGEHSLPVVLAGVEVMLDGHRIPLISISPSQIQAQLPYGLSSAASSLYIRTKSSDGTPRITNAVALQIVPASPGIFALSGSEPRMGMLLHGDSKSGSTGIPITSGTPAKPGEVLTLWATGLGNVTVAEFGKVVEAGQPYAASDSQTQTPVEVYLNGQMLPVLYAGLSPGAIGIYEVRVVLPITLSPGYKPILSISQAGYNSNAVTFSVESTIH